MQFVVMVVLMLLCIPVRDTDYGGKHFPSEAWDSDIPPLL